MNVWMDLDETFCNGQLCLGSKHFSRFIAKARCFARVRRGLILMILIYIIDLDEMLKLTKGQGHKVKVKYAMSDYRGNQPD